MDIIQLQRRVHQTAVEHGWWVVGEHRNIGELLALVHSEISEALEVYRSGRMLGDVWYNDNKPEGFMVELADAIIRIADIAEHYQVNLETVLLEKMAYNDSRAYRHGGKLA